MSKKLSLLALFTLMPAAYFYAQTTVFAYIKDEREAPVESAEVSIANTALQVTADKIGYFQFRDMKPGQYQLVINKPPYATQTFSFEVKEDEARKDLGVFHLVLNVTDVDQGFAVLDDSDQSDELSNLSTVGLLQSSRDVYSNVASYDLSAYWFRPRGIDSRTGEFLLNGISMERPDTGTIDFSAWGGLNDITRYPEVAINQTPSEYSFGGIGSSFYKNTKASEYRKGSEITYSSTDRNYNNRLSFRYTSGMSKSGWAFTGMVARRWAKEGRAEGTFYDAISGYLGIEKKISDAHTVTLNAIGSHYRRSTSSPNTQEVTDFRGIHYNAYWGWYDGRKRSERVKKGFMPIIQLSDYWKISDKTQLWTTLSYQFGKEKGARLDWYKANNPSPVYYKNLPSYWDNLDEPRSPMQLDNAQLVRSWWETNDQAHTQIDWNALYQANLGGPITADGKRAYYFLENDVKDNKIWAFNTHMISFLSDHVKLLLNFSYRSYKSEQYREIKDLLGADYVLNMDPFAKSDKGGSFNTMDPDSHKKKGDKFDYDYIFRRDDVKFNPSLKFSTGKFDALVSGMLSYSSNSREGLFSHYLYDSFGKSDTKKFWDGGAKLGLTYRLSGRMFLVYNGAYYSQAPYMNDLFINARYSNATAPDIQSKVIDANDLSYVISAPNVKMRLTGYLTNTRKDTQIQRFFADGIRLNTLDEEGEEIQGDNRALVTQVLSNVNTRNFGAELGLQVKLSPTVTANGSVSLGQFTYNNNPELYIASDNVGIFRTRDEHGNIVESETKDMGKAFLKDYKLGGTPQKAFTAGLTYNSPKYWWVGASWNYLMDSYLDPSPATRTTDFITNPVTNVPYDGLDATELRRVLRQVSLPDTYFINLIGGKSWRFGKYYVSVFAVVNNVLNNRKYITGGFEQTRYLTYDNFVKDFDRDYPNFAPKYFYSDGRSYFLNLKFSF